MYLQIILQKYKISLVPLSVFTPDYSMKCSHFKNFVIPSWNSVKKQAYELRANLNVATVVWLLK